MELESWLGTMFGGDERHFGHLVTRIRAISGVCTSGVCTSGEVLVNSIWLHWEKKVSVLEPWFTGILEVSILMLDLMCLIECQGSHVMVM